MKIFSGNSNKKLALKIAKILKTELSPVEIFLFPDGEKRIRIKENVVGEECIVVQSASMPPDENYMELFIMIDALKRSGAKSVKALIPYLGYQRQDHVFRDGEAVSLEVIANILKAVGMSEGYSFDLHSPKIPEVFSVPLHDLSALPKFWERIKKDFNLNDLVLVSPDMGGIRRIKEVSEALGNIPYATVTKNRDLSSGEINDSQLDGDVRGKISVIVDDMISTGKTMVEAAQMLIENGALKVFVFATHAVLATDADKLLQNSKIERVFVSDTIDVPAFKIFPKLEVISVSDIAAKALKP
ncbi:MAG TPA: ribose-phosphate pyrophosphokinase [Candidatus Sulfotelmatobacter sp.]|nr:ribose-phosphate pyrophosphokinase [Candidatus Sulfotelmatobacter sp.]